MNKNQKKMNEQIKQPANFILILMFALMLIACKKAPIGEDQFKVDTAESIVGWKGFATDHFHIGSFDVSGDLSVDKNGRVISGNFSIPIASIDNFDLEGEIRTQLLNHLKSPDFFNMLVYPNAEFNFEEIQDYSKQEAGNIENANKLIKGHFRMLGVTKEISFPAKISNNGKEIRCEAKFKIDRTQWGMTYDSDPEKPLYIFPYVDIHLDVLAKTTL